MIFEQDEITATSGSVNPDWETIVLALQQIDPDKKAFFNLSRDPDNYIQCAGSEECLTVEWRTSENGIYKHFVFGKEKPDNMVVWTQINCRVGPIRIHTNEVLAIEDALCLFNSFYKNEAFPAMYVKRNVSKLFAK